MKSYRLLGVNVNALTVGELNHLIKTTVEDGRKAIIANHNLHSVYLFHHDQKMRRFFGGADFIHIDGMLLIVWARLLGMNLKIEHRVTYVDWINTLLREAAIHKWRVFYLGGERGVAEKAVKVVNAQFPGLQVRQHHGWFDRQGEANREVLAAIDTFKPHVLLVGMGMPRQEYWILDNYQEIAANAVLTAGACFDYLAGAVPTPPRWLGRAGLEGAYRLLHEPRRLWRRYLWEPWFILRLAAEDLAGLVRRH